MILISLLYTLLFTQKVTSYSYLFIPEWHSASHIGSMMPFAERLRDRGHKVTFFDINFLKKPRKYPTGIDSIQLQMEYEEEATDWMWQTITRGARIWGSSIGGDKVFVESMEKHSEIYDRILKHPWDMVIADGMFDNHGYTLAIILKEKRNIPYAVFFTSTMFYAYYVVNAMGRDPISRMSMFPSPPSNPYQPYDPTDFYQRIDQLRDALTEYALIGYRAPLHHQHHQSLVGRPFDWVEFYSEASFVVSDHIQAFGKPMPTGQDLITAGSHCENKDEKLGKELQKFVEDPESKGTIYVAFGSIVRWDEAPESIKTTYADAVNQLTEYRILFTYPLSDRQFLPHVKILKWAPQAAILQHTKTKAFVTHGGLKSTREALCSLVPAIYMPVFAEQGQNARMTRELGMSLTLNKFTVTSEEIVEAIREVANNDSYKKNVQHYYKIYKDTVIPELDRAAFFAEKTIRIGDKREVFFKRKGMQLYWIQHLYIDWIVAFFVVIFIINK